MFDKIGGYEKNYTFLWRDDTDLQFRLMDEGKFVFADDAVVYHPKVRRGPHWSVHTLRFLFNEFIFLRDRKGVG